MADRAQGRAVENTVPIDRQLRTDSSLNVLHTVLNLPVLSQTDESRKDRILIFMDTLAFSAMITLTTTGKKQFSHRRGLSLFSEGFWGNSQP